MSDATSRLSLPYILPAQAQKHVTHNEALARLDGVVQMVIEAFDASTPPASPTEGQSWALGAAPVQDWAGQAGQIAVAQNGGWIFIAPQVGWQAVDRGALDLRLWTGTEWIVYATGSLDQVEGLGINTGYDAVNALAVAAPASLLTHGGPGATGGHQLKINKAAATDTASLLYQTGFSGRAEMGTAGTDDFEIKVSATGSTWFSGMQIAGATGRITAPNGLRVTGAVTGNAVMQNATDTTTGRLMTTGAFGLGTPVQMVDFNTDPGASGFNYAISNAANRPDPVMNTAGLTLRGFNANNTAQLSIATDAGAAIYVRGEAGGTYGPWRQVRTTANTTVDANGFIKAASPIVQLGNDGIEEPVTPVGAVFARKGTGHYTLSGVEPLATSGWQIEVPQDHNGNRLVFAETRYDGPARVLTVKTASVVWDGERGVWAGGMPCDIPAGRWIDVRFHEPGDGKPTGEETVGQ